MSQKNETPVLIISLLLTLGLIAGAALWFTKQSGFSLGGLTSPKPAVSGTDGSAGATFSAIQNVPSGLFNYGGSTSWAPIRGQIDPAIATVFPEFRLRYTDPLTGSPGSTTGIRMLLDNQLSFAQSSRSLKPEEYQEAKSRGFTLKEIPVAIEGIAIAVHPSLNLSGLTLDQLKGIYSGQTTNWSQVGGPNLAIVPYSRGVGGTVEFFQENILAGQNFGNSVRFVSTTTEALRGVASNRGALYYASAPEVVGQCTTKPLAVGRRSNELVPPYQGSLIPASQCPAKRNQMNEAALQSGQYPITRRLFVIVKENNQVDQQVGEAYANLLLTNQGQELLSKSGFVRLR